MKIRPVGVESFHADRQTGMTKLIVAFRNFVQSARKMKDVNEQKQLQNSHTNLQFRGTKNDVSKENKGRIM